MSSHLHRLDLPIARKLLLQSIGYLIAPEGGLDHRARAQLLKIFGHFSIDECTKLTDILSYRRYDLRRELSYLLSRIGLSEVDAHERAELLEKRRSGTLTPSEKLRLQELYWKFHGLTEEDCAIHRELCASKSIDHQQADLLSYARIIEESREELNITLPDPERGPYAENTASIVHLLSVRCHL